MGLKYQTFATINFITAVLFFEFNGEYMKYVMKKHYKYNGSAWSQVSILPFSASNTKAIAYNNAIYLAGFRYV